MVSFKLLPLYQRGQGIPRVGIHIVGKRSISTTAETGIPFLGRAARTLARILNEQGSFIHTYVENGGTK
jgi:hypothetical protein